MIEAIAAIGRRGQLGLNGTIPWHDSEDLKWFKSVSMEADFLICGRNTLSKLPVLSNRQIIPWSRTAPEVFLKNIGYDEKIDNALVIGGAATYAAFRPFIKRWHISRIDYDGPADVWMPRIW